MLKCHKLSYNGIGRSPVLKDNLVTHGCTENYGIIFPNIYKFEDFYKDSLLLLMSLYVCIHACECYVNHKREYCQGSQNRVSHSMASVGAEVLNDLL